MATVSVIPGTSTMSPAIVTTWGAKGWSQLAHIAVVSAISRPPTGSKRRPVSRNRAAASAHNPITRPPASAATISRQPPPKNRAADPEARANDTVETQAL